MGVVSGTDGLTEQENHPEDQHWTQNIESVQEHSHCITFNWPHHAASILLWGWFVSAAGTGRLDNCGTVWTVLLFRLNNCWGPDRAWSGPQTSLLELNLQHKNDLKQAAKITQERLQEQTEAVLDWPSRPNTGRKSRWTTLLIRPKTAVSLTLPDWAQVDLQRRMGGSGQNRCVKMSQKWAKKEEKQFSPNIFGVKY